MESDGAPSVDGGKAPLLGAPPRGGMVCFRPARRRRKKGMRRQRRCPAFAEMPMVRARGRRAFGGVAPGTVSLSVATGPSYASRYSARCVTGSIYGERPKRAVRASRSAAGSSPGSGLVRTERPHRFSIGSDWPTTGLCRYVPLATR